MVTFHAPASALVDAKLSSHDRFSIAELRGKKAVLAIAPVLESLAARCGQLGAVDYLEYFLTGPYVGPKTPCVFLFRSPDCTRSASELDETDVRGAVLMYEYRMCGLRTKIFATDDEGGERTVLAPLCARPRIAAVAAEYLIRTGAQLVFMSIGSEDHAVSQAMQSMEGHRGKPSIWTTRERRVRRYLLLQSTYDETLATMGKHTRRNLRAFRRRAEAELHADFVSVAELSRDDLVTLNGLCSYPVPDRVAAWRHRTATELIGSFLLGIRSGDGRWLSLLGGRRHHGTTEVAWQMNREGLEAFSIGTVMRSYLIEHEIALGTKRREVSAPGRLLRRETPEISSGCRPRWNNANQREGRGAGLYRNDEDHLRRPA